jgi:hypothetical protein
MINDRNGERTTPSKKSKEHIMQFLSMFTPDIQNDDNEMTEAEINSSNAMLKKDLKRIEKMLGFKNDEFI